MAKIIRALLDTSILIGNTIHNDFEAAISVASVAELHFGILVAKDEDERAFRIQRLSVIESIFEPLPITVQIGREWGRLSAAVANRGGQPRSRAVDLVIAATANIHHVSLITMNVKDFAIISDLCEVRLP